MPLPLVPVVIAAVVGAAAVGALVYFFTSNKAAARREQYMGEVQAVLKLLKKKVDLLIGKLATLTQERDGACQEVERLKKELEAAQREWDVLQAELGRWCDFDHALPTAVSIITASTLLRTNRYRPQRALRHLQQRRSELTRELDMLDPQCSVIESAGQRV